MVQTKDIFAYCHDMMPGEQQARAEDEGSGTPANRGPHLGI
jgi:hypothetical protein